MTRSARRLEPVERVLQRAELAEVDVVAVALGLSGGDSSPYGWIAKPSPVAGRKRRQAAARLRSKRA